MELKLKIEQRPASDRYYVIQVNDNWIPTEMTGPLSWNESMQLCRKILRENNTLTPEDENHLRNHLYVRGDWGSVSIVVPREKTP